MSTCYQLDFTFCEQFFCSAFFFFSLATLLQWREEKIKQHFDYLRTLLLLFLLPPELINLGAPLCRIYVKC